MKNHLLPLSTVALLAFSCRSSPEAPAERDPKPPPAEISMEDAMVLVMEAAMPGAPHAKLATLVGNWSITGRSRMAKGAPWNEFTADATAQTILDGRFLTMDIRGSQTEGMPQAYRGFAVFGHDNLTGEFTQLYLTNYSTAARRLAGPIEGDSIVMTGTYANPMFGGAEEPAKLTLTLEDDDRFVWREYAWTEDGEEYVSIEVEHARR